MRILYFEPFDGGSHAAFTKTLTTAIDADWSTCTLPGRHWKWRMRGAVPYFAEVHRDTLTAPADLVFASSYVPLAELYGLVPALVGTPSVLYFHENQLTYPNQEDAARDHHFGFTQLVSALAATACWFNSAYNMNAFLEAGADLLKRMPDAIRPGWIESIREKSEVLPVPLLFTDEAPPPSERGPPLILWNHRWEHDKDPDAFFDALDTLDAAGTPFRLAVCGRRYRRYPAVFDRARERFKAQLVHFGEADVATYQSLLRRADVAVSTSRHEFFGIAMLEATHHGAFPLVPDDLVYPELFPRAHRYVRGDLAARLGALLTSETPLRADRRALTAPFGAPLISRYKTGLTRLAVR